MGLWENVPAKKVVHGSCKVTGPYALELGQSLVELVRQIIMKTSPGYWYSLGLKSFRLVPPVNPKEFILLPWSVKDYPGNLIPAP